MLILALDLATETGWAIGDGSAPPRSGATRLKRGDEERPVAMGALLALIDGLLREAKADLVVREAPLSLRAYGTGRGGLVVSQANIEMAYGLHGVTEAITARWGITLETVYPATVRAHFLGRANMGERPETKRAVVERAHLLGLMPGEIKNDSRADACAIWHWAQCKFARTFTGQFRLFLPAPRRGVASASA